MSVLNDLENLGNTIASPFTGVANQLVSTATAAGNQVASVATTAGNEIAAISIGAINAGTAGTALALKRIANKSVSAANSFAGGAQSAGASVWRATSAEADYIGKSVESVGLHVTDGLIEGFKAADVGVKQGVEKVAEGAVAVKEFVEKNICNILVGSGISAIFAALAGSGEAEVSTAAVALAASQSQSSMSTGAGNLLTPAAKALAVIVAKPVYEIPGVSSSGINRSQLETIITFLIVKACKDRINAVVGSGGQFLMGVMVYGITKLACEGTVPAGYQAWTVANADTVANVTGTFLKRVPFNYYEGQRVRTSQDGKAYVVLDGLACHIPDVATYNNIFATWDGLLEIGTTPFNIGPALTVGAYLGVDGRNNGVYLVSNNKKRHVVSPQVMVKCGFRSDKFRALTATVSDQLITSRAIDGLISPDGPKAYDSSLDDPRVFNAAFYLKCYPDLTAAFGTNFAAAHEHWVTVGFAKEGRRGSRAFDTQFYLGHYPDLKAAFGSNYMAALTHWLSPGLPNEGRAGSADFDPQFYLAAYSDLKAAYGANYKVALDHWLGAGLNEGRRGSA